MERHRFIAHLFHVGLNYGVLVPPDVVDALGGGRYIDVEGTADGAEFATRLNPADEGQRLLYLDHNVREQAGIDIGADVEIHLWLAPPEHHHHHLVDELEQRAVGDEEEDAP